MFVSFTPQVAGILSGQLPVGNLAGIAGRRAGFNPRGLRGFAPRVPGGIPANPRAQVAPPPQNIDPITGGIDLVTQGNDLVIEGAATGDIGMVAAGAEMRDRGENVNKAIVKKRKSIKQVIEDQLS